MVPYYTDVYTVDGSRILSEVRTDDQLYTVVRTLYYIYDASGSVIGMEYNGAKYWYDKNLQGDIVGIRNSAGTLVAQYVYDAGNVNLFQASEAAKYYSVKRLPAVVVDGRVLSSPSASAITGAVK